MTQPEASRQFSFRLPESMVEQIEECAASIREQGLDVNRADVVRLLISHSLESTQCKLDLLLRSNPTRSTPRSRREGNGSPKKRVAAARRRRE
jgi:Arc/MetJ-type ribon-helix-helix transcriptional regulator